LLWSREHLMQIKTFLTKEKSWLNEISQIILTSSMQIIAATSQRWSGYRQNVTQHLIVIFYVLLTVHLVIIFVNNQIDAQFFFMYVYFYSLHVSGSHVSIIRRINCINTTSGICHCVDDHLVCRFGWDSSGELTVSIQHLVYVTV